MKLSPEFSGSYWLFIVKILWASILCHRMRNLKDNGRTLDVNDQLCSGRPVSTTHNGNRQKLGYFLEHKL